YHGVCHANWLENVAALASEGAFLGAIALLKSMPEVQLYLDAVNFAELYLALLTGTHNSWDVQVAIANFHSSVRHRRPEAIPH
ncbi:MAG TPA: hypothetical protein VFA89_10825, partial [Terriglobales bacterium]|nr:hypothetical protein [Terriglobales bacterium]